jgi:hypothetical protein
VALVFTSGCADDVAPAARVGDASISTDELLAEVGEWAAEPDSPRGTELQDSGTAWGYPMEAVSVVLHEQIVLEILGEAFDDLDLELSPDLLAQTEARLSQDPTVGPSFPGFSDEFTDAYVEAYAKGFAVQTSMAEADFNELLRQGAREVEVNPRYGTWDATTVRLVVPEGSRPPPGAEVLDPLAQP